MKIEKGLYRFKNNELGIDSEILKKAFETNYRKYSNKSYENVASIESANKFDPDILNIYQAIEKNFKLSEQGYEFSKVWFVKSHPKDCDSTKLPYVPHIDKVRFLKVMIYVNQVTNKDGPFYCVTEDIDRETYEKKRRSLGNSHKIEQANRISDFDKSAYQAVIGNEGDVIVFDTNIPHYAGEVDPGGERKVIRFDYALNHWNKSSVMKKVSNLFK